MVASMKLFLSHLSWLCSVAGSTDIESRRHHLFAHGLRDRGLLPSSLLGKVQHTGQLRGKQSPQPPGGMTRDTDTLAGEVIDQAMTNPSSKQFSAADVNGDGHILEWEYAKTSKDGAQLAHYQFKCIDNNMDGAVDPKEFANAQADHKKLSGCVDTMIAFRMVDKNHDGSLSHKEMWSTVGDMRYGQRWAFMLVCSDQNQDGKVSPMEFSSDIYGCMEDKTSEANMAFANFNKSDTNANGCVDKAEMTVVMKRTLGLDQIKRMDLSREYKSAGTLAQKWILCTDWDGDGCLNQKEYATMLDPSSEQGTCMGDSFKTYEIDMDFEIMDTSNDGKVSKQEYYVWVNNIDVSLDQKEADRIFESADTNKDGFVDKAEFDVAGKTYNGDGSGALFLHTIVPGHRLGVHSPASPHKF